MKYRITAIAALFVLVTTISLYSFNQIKPKQVAIASADNGGKLLFTTHCSTCHTLADPASLTKAVWQLHVLPVMASRMGIIYPGYDPLRGLSDEERVIVAKNHIIATEPEMSDADWRKLSKYIVDNAPDSIAIDESRYNRNLPLIQFKRNDVELDSGKPSMITSIKYNTDTKTLWVGDFYNQAINWQYGKGIVKTIKTVSAPVDFDFYKGDTYLTDIGKLYPSELNSGSYIKLNQNDVGTSLTQPLHRPVSSVIDDLNGDGVPEVVICSFGNKTGALSLFKQGKNGKYAEHVLLPLAGAIKCFVRDMDDDGKKDIVAMFSQGDESVYIFYQKDNLKFRAKRVLRFPPNYGTTDMVLVDYNHDGLTDIVTVHGDNADYSSILKPYHGIRINIDAGNNTFKEKFFYPIYGVTRVLAEDFDKDGDIDFVATSFFPDFDKLVDESFIYLENNDQKAYTFKSYILKSDVPIKTLALEKADIDGDGDMDIIVGNFSQSPGRIPKSLDDKWKSAKFGLSLFINQTNPAANQK
jgi:hypothetical protein